MRRMQTTLGARRPSLWHPFQQRARLFPLQHRVALRHVVPGAAGVRHGAVAAGIDVVVVILGGEGREAAAEDRAGEEVEGFGEARRLLVEAEGELLRLDAAEDQRLDRAPNAVRSAGEEPGPGPGIKAELSHGTTGE